MSRPRRRPRTLQQIAADLDPPDPDQLEADVAAAVRAYRADSTPERHANIGMTVRHLLRYMPDDDPDP